MGPVDLQAVRDGIMWALMWRVVDLKADELRANMDESEAWRYCTLDGPGSRAKVIGESPEELARLFPPSTSPASSPSSRGSTSPRPRHSYSRRDLTKPS